jgi:hypothetical protein
VSLNETWSYDGTTWTPVVSEPTGARGHNDIAYHAGADRTVTFGGWDSPGNTHYQDTWLFDGTSWSELTPSAPGVTQGYSLAYDSKRGRVVMFGGSDDTPVALADTWELY